MNIYDRIYSYVKATKPGNRTFNLSEKDMHDILTWEGDRDTPDAAELDELFPDRHEWQ